MSDDCKTEEQKPEDYKRTICNFCPSKTICKVHRVMLECDDCNSPCVYGDSVMDCTVLTKIRTKWQKNLPSKCLLAEQVMVAFLQTANNAEPKGFIRRSDGRVVCPRCLRPTFYLTSSHDWTPVFGGGGRRSKFKGHCILCNLDVEAALS